MTFARCSRRSAFLRSTTSSRRSPKVSAWNGRWIFPAGYRSRRSWPTWLPSPVVIGPGMTWCVSPAAAPTTTSSRAWCGRSQDALSSTPPTRRTSRSSPKGSCRRSSSSSRWCANSRRSTSRTRRCTTARRPSSRPSTWPAPAADRVSWSPAASTLATSRRSARTAGGRGTCRRCSRPPVAGAHRRARSTPMSRRS